MKAIVWGFDNSLTNNAVKKLQDEGFIEVCEWFGSPESAYSVYPTRDWMDVLRSPERFSFELYNSELAICMQEHMETILDLFSRNFLFRYSPYYEYENAAYFLLAYFYKLLREKKIEVVFMDDIPHGPGNYILYLVAKKLNIKVLILCQSHFANRFFYLTDIDDFGLFQQVPRYREKMQTEKIEHKFEKNWFYQGVSWEKKLKPKLGLRQKLNKRAIKWKQSIAKYRDIQELLYLKYAQKGIEYQRKREHSENHATFFTMQVAKDCKYVYFPLHLQPEMTTSILGGSYSNQLLALEHLAECIPADWKIYVKEYPGQSYFMRDKYFFRRLALNPKAVLLKGDINTYELIRNSQFVATLVGTVGWEAISGGKNVLIFGHAWYRKLPGVFEYKRGMDISELQTYLINHSELENKLNELFMKTGNAMISPEYLPLVGKEFNAKENNDKVYRFFLTILPFLLNNTKAMEEEGCYGE